MGDGAGDTLQYNLYSDATHTTLWGDGTTGGLTVAGTGAGMGAGKVQNSTVYGQVLDSATNQTAAASSAYTDTITVTGPTTYVYGVNALGGQNYQQAKVVKFAQDGVIVCQTN